MRDIKNILRWFVISFISIGLYRVIVSFREKGIVVYEGQIIGMDDYYKKLTGYDSIQIISKGGKPEANFCYPNK